MTLQAGGEWWQRSKREKLLAFRLLASATGSAALLMQAPLVMAQEPSPHFNIPAQPLASAINVYGRQSGLQVSLAAATSQGVTSRAVSGNLSAQAALGQLLEGTGIPFSISNGTAVIGRMAETSGGDDGQDGTVLSPITVEGQPVGQGDVSETVIGAEQLERLNPINIADAFRQEAGVQVGSSLPMSQKVYVRGVEETNLAVSIDGARQNNKVFHHNATNLIDPSFLRAVEIDSGIAPADAGPGALAGSINYMTRDVADLLADGQSVGGFVTSTYNFNSDTVVTGLSAYGRKDGLDVFGYFTFGKGNEFRGGNGDVVAGTETNMLSGLGKIGYEFESGHRIEISHDRVVDDAQRPYRANAGSVDSGSSWEEPETRNYRLERQNTVFTFKDTTPEGWWDPTIKLGYGSTKVRVGIYNATGYRYDDTGTTATLNGKFENRFSFDIGNVVAGFDFYRDQAELDDPVDAGAEKSRNIGLYAQARLDPWDRTRLSFGARADHQWFIGADETNFTNAGVSANISGEYDLTDIFTAKAGFSHVWAGVPLTENFVINPGWDYGPEGPKPVTSNNYLIGLEADHNGFTAQATVFRTEIDSARTPFYRYSAAVPAPFPGALPALRARDLVSQGFEIGAGYEWATGFVKVGYVHIDVDVDGLPANSDSGNYLATPVGDIITVSAAHRFEEWNLTIGGDIEIAPEYDHVVSGAPPYKAYEVVNVFTQWKPEQMPHFTFRAEVKNLFDASYADRATYGQEFGNVRPLFEPGRSFLMSAKASF
ncbi:hemoglobin/transferrin/lactoferrin receptor protein [Neorhizobium huautlense]|uniref:Hemoglobin/transferrin/lactoferrin receptor protein n=1 Tax=Neorhizobium huautlense TaxID=67774 RepID=A0ABT9PPZ9_9HYPH|nr:TonB-dependent receptor [Neorhizobium huautlense]MDP9836551.1 hemoglobin/transferrin/lactoferrin receptor protein [Neorhizobium huautlense]